VSKTEAHELLARLRAEGAILRGLSCDSRHVQTHDLFLAFPGYQTDGRAYIEQALAKGAGAVLWDNFDGYTPSFPMAVPNLGLRDLRHRSGWLAHLMYGTPSERLWLAGVTGTNGKTTVSQWLTQALEACGVRCGVIGTLGSGFPGQLRTGFNTTPDAITMHRTLAEFVAQGAMAAAMEVSSIGLDQGRVNGGQFDVAILTNLTRDHLDYHGNMEAYAAAKARLFRLPDLACSVINLDDSFGLTLARQIHAEGNRVIGYTRIRSNAEALPGAPVLIGDALQQTPSGLRFTLEWEGERVDVQARMVASFNVANLLAVACALLSREMGLRDIARVLSRLTPPEGRMQILGGFGEPLVVVDYAHTPDALAKVLESLRETATQRHGRLVVVFGCGGDRDPGKRALMGDVARLHADTVILTSDNPRTENPDSILAQIAQGVGEDAQIIVDRQEAIFKAVAHAHADDVVLIAGKGHEPYQEISGRLLPFSDIEKARQAIAAWSSEPEKKP
jgi:UDP-N-acetylmuramoyl-L-alanyl-D-glutamate--2,6-diaminopimelate ligase